ncbi:hypothetical protein AP064_04280 [Candidatus Liberibacter solanacearum]|nr:hypothetical protein KP07_01980 [Candidatus Liberibacter solanacearum]KQC48999.1 hypothetical protein AP064_04280 [Candidatus Liberibacter solanacearum]
MCIWGLMFRIILFFWNQIGNLLLFSMGLRFRYVMNKIFKNKVVVNFNSAVLGFKSFIVRFFSIYRK